MFAAGDSDAGDQTGPAKALSPAYAHGVITTVPSPADHVPMRTQRGKLVSCITAAGYSITVTIQSGGSPIVLTGFITVDPAPGTCPGQTGRALVFGAAATPPFAPGNVVCLDRVDPSLGACVGVGPECLAPFDQRPHLHRTMVVVGTPGGTFPDPDSTGCGQGLVVGGYPRCGSDPVPICGP